MRIIISPAKKMREDTDSLPWRDFPVFLPRTEVLLQKLREMSADDLKKLWKCNDQIAALNIDRLTRMDLRGNLTPAILAYDGIQYQYMASCVFTDREYDYLQEHLRILSGFYGILRPFDGVMPYRLEMQARLQTCKAKDLYSYWGDSIAWELFSGAGCIINLASKEYSVCVSKYLPKDIRFITCVFGEEKDGKIIEKATLCKMARGEMVRFMAEQNVTDPEELKNFGSRWRYCAERSDDDTYVFIPAEQPG